MTSLAPSANPLAELSDDVLRDRRDKCLDMAAKIERELAERGQDVAPTRNSCGHPDAEPAIIRPFGGSECASCALARMRVETRRSSEWVRPIAPALWP